MMSAENPERVYGVEFSGGRVTVMCMRRRAGGRAGEMLAAHVATADNPAWRDLAARIALEQQRGLARVSAVARAHECVVRPVEVPLDSAEKARAVMPSLLDVQLPFPVEQCVCNFVQIRRKPSGGGTRAVAVAIPHDRLSDLIEELKLSGIDPEYIEAESIALWRAVSNADECARPGVCVVVHLACDRTVMVLGHDGMPVSTFNARASWNPANDAAGAEKMCGRLRQFLAGQTREGDAPVRFIVAGAGAAAGAESLRVALGVDPGNWRVLEKPENVLVQSLAASLVEPDGWSTNLRVGSFEHPHLARDRQRFARQSSLWVAGAAALLLLVSWLAAAVMAHQEKKWQQAVREKAQALTGFADINQAKIALSTITPADQALEEWRMPHAYPVLAGLVQEAHQRGLHLEMVSVRDGVVSVRGDGPAWNDADQVAARMREAGLVVADGAVERSEAGRDERIHFSVRGTQP